MNWTMAASRNSEDLNLVSSEAVAAAYMAHWQNRQAVSVPFARREDWCRKPEVADVTSEGAPAGCGGKARRGTEQGDRATRHGEGRGLAKLASPLRMAGYGVTG